MTLTGRNIQSNLNLEPMYYFNISQDTRYQTRIKHLKKYASPLLGYMLLSLNFSNIQ